MRISLRFLLVFLLIVLISCSRSNNNKQVKDLPKDLNSAMDFFIKKWNRVEINNFKNKPEIDAVNELHFSVGIWIRNNWIRGKRDSNLVNYFNNEGAYNPDDISSLILTSLHRKLNNKPIYLKEQIEIYKAYSKRIANCEEIAKKKAVEKYDQLKIGHQISILMDVDTSGNSRNATTLICPSTDWKFNSKKDLRMEGIVVDKYTINSDSNVFFKFRITKMNFPNTEILSDTVRIGSVISLSLENLNVE